MFEIPHLRNRIYRALSEVFECCGEPDSARTCREHLAVACGV